MESYINIIRKLAKSNKYQGIYSLAKEMKLKIFENETDFTDIQLIFLRYLNYYSSLNMDITLNEVDEIVLSNNIYEDSYMLYRSSKEYKKKKETAVNSKNNNNRNGEGSVNIGRTSKWIFKSPPKNK